MRTGYSDTTVIEVKSFEVETRLLPDDRSIEEHLDAVELLSQSPWNVFWYAVAFEDERMAAFDYFDQYIFLSP